MTVQAGLCQTWSEPKLLVFSCTAVQAQKLAREWKFLIKKVEESFYPCSENKGADQLRGTVKLICVFVFAYADCWFSHEAAQITSPHKQGLQNLGQSTQTGRGGGGGSPKLGNPTSTCSFRAIYPRTSVRL